MSLSRFLPRILVLLLTVPFLFMCAPEPAGACSVELSVLLAFQKLDPEFTASVRTIDRVLRLKAVPISNGEDVDLSLADIQPALDEWNTLRERYDTDTMPAFFYDKKRWKENREWLKTLFSTMQRRVKAGEKEAFHDTVWAIEDIFLDLYKKRGKQDPRIVHSQLLALKQSSADDIFSTVTTLKQRIDDIEATIIPKDARERAIARNTEEIGEKLGAFLALPRNQLEHKLPGLIKRVSVLENLILNLRWFEDQGEPAEIRWMKIKQDL